MIPRPLRSVDEDPVRVRLFLSPTRTWFLWAEWRTGPLTLGEPPSTWARLYDGEVPTLSADDPALSLHRYAHDQVDTRMPPVTDCLTQEVPQLASSVREGAVDVPTDPGFLKHCLPMLSVGACHPVCPWPFLSEFVCKAALALFE